MTMLCFRSNLLDEFHKNSQSQQDPQKSLDVCKKLYASLSDIKITVTNRSLPFDEFHQCLYSGRGKTERFFFVTYNSLNFITIN